MILDTIEHAERYHAVHPVVAAALKALRDPALLAREDGRYPLDGERLVAIVQRYDSKPADQCVWEAHRHYIDVQFVVEGMEAMGHVALASATPRTDYDSVKDVQFFEPPTERDRATLLAVGAGSFAVFFPHDVHSPGIASGGRPARVRKIVIKVGVEWV
jgi:YhcH/YjgK/YiaL family protein